MKHPLLIAMKVLQLRDRLAIPKIPTSWLLCMPTGLPAGFGGLLLAGLLGVRMCALTPLHV